MTPPAWLRISSDSVRQIASFGLLEPSTPRDSNAELSAGHGGGELLLLGRSPEHDHMQSSGLHAEPRRVGRQAHRGAR